MKMIKRKELFGYINKRGALHKEAVSYTFFDFALIYLYAVLIITTLN
jgi:hypothetical protein